MSMPLPGDVSPPTTKSEGELTIDERSFILDSTLNKKNRGNVIIIAFIDSFIRCKSIAQASAEVGIHKSLGYSYRHRQDISNAIQKLIDKSTIKHGFDSSEILERVKEVVDFDPIELENPDGTFKKHMHEIAPEARRCLSSLEVNNIWGKTSDLNGIETKIIIGEIIKYKFYDKLKAGELVGKEKDMFKSTTKVVHDVTKNMKSVLLESAARADKLIGQNTNNVVEAEYVNVTEKTDE